MTTKFRPPSTTVSTVDDFRQCGWSDSAPTESSYFALWDSLCKKGFEATQANELAKAKILWLLADACSFRFEAANINEPFVSTELNEFGRPRNLDSFTDEDIALFTQIYPEIADLLLRSRLADIVWLRSRPRRDRHAALAAIDAYRLTPLTTEDWYRDGKNCWSRGVMLSLQLRAASGQRAVEMAAVLLAAVKELVESPDEINAAVSMARALLDLEVASASYPELGELLSARGERLNTERKFFHARNNFTLAGRFFAAFKNEDRQADMTYAVAQTFVGEAVQRTSGSRTSYNVAVDFYTDAIQKLREIPRTLRLARGVDVEMEQLYAKLKEAQTRSLDEFAPIRSGSVDIRDLVDQATKYVADRDFAAALFSLAACCTLTSYEDAEQQAKAVMRETLFSRSFGMRRAAIDGRVVEKTPPPGDLDDDSPQTKAAVRAHMIRDHQHRMQFVASSAIGPALQQFVLDHLITLEDLGNLVAQSGIVQTDRHYLVARGIKAGFDGEFAVALHLLVPQLEHMVRTHLQRKGIKTTTLSLDGIQMEIGLSSLAESPAMESVFGKDLTFEIQAAFCEQSGPNLRNDLAHGLLSAGAAQSAESLYAWWLVFRMVFLNFWLPDKAPDEAE